MTRELVGEAGTLKSLQLVRVDVAGGVPTPIEGSEFELEADMLLLAIGFTGPHTEILTSQLGIEIGPRGNIAVDSEFQSSVPGVYSAGDSCRGASLIVWAISDGREAARAIDTALRTDKQPRLPTKGRDCLYGGR